MKRHTTKLDLRSVKLDKSRFQYVCCIDEEKYREGIQNGSIPFQISLDGSVGGHSGLDVVFFAVYSKLCKLLPDVGLSNLWDTALLVSDRVCSANDLPKEQKILTLEHQQKEPIVFRITDDSLAVASVHREAAAALKELQRITGCNWPFEFQMQFDFFAAECALTACYLVHDSFKAEDRRFFLAPVPQAHNHSNKTIH